MARMTARSVVLLGFLFLLSPARAAEPVAKTDGEIEGLRIEVVELKRSSADTVTLRFNLINDSDATFDHKGWYFGDYTGHQNQDINNVGAINLIDTAGKKNISSCVTRTKTASAATKFRRSRPNLASCCGRNFRRHPPTCRKSAS